MTAMDSIVDVVSAVLLLGGGALTLAAASSGGSLNTLRACVPSVLSESRSEARQQPRLDHWLR